MGCTCDRAPDLCPEHLRPVFVDYMKLVADIPPAPFAATRAVDRALAVDRSIWKVGQLVWLHDEPRDRHGTFEILEIDWDRAAGPIKLGPDGQAPHHNWPPYLYVQPWVLRHVPQTLAEVEAFLAS